MLEVLQYVTSDFWVFIGSTFFCCALTISAGWSLNAVCNGIRGN